MAINLSDTGRSALEASRRRTGLIGYLPCCVCGGAVRVDRPWWGVYVHDGGGVAVTEAEYDAMNDGEADRGYTSQMGIQAVGPDCRRAVPGLAAITIRMPAEGDAP